MLSSVSLDLKYRHGSVNDLKRTKFNRDNRKLCAKCKSHILNNIGDMEDHLEMASAHHSNTCSTLRCDSNERVNMTLPCEDFRHEDVSERLTCAMNTTTTACCTEPSQTHDESQSNRHLHSPKRYSSSNCPKTPCNICKKCDCSLEVSNNFSLKECCDFTCKLFSFRKEISRSGLRSEDEMPSLVSHDRIRCGSPANSITPFVHNFKDHSNKFMKPKSKQSTEWPSLISNFDCVSSWSERLKSFSHLVTPSPKSGLLRDTSRRISSLSSSMIYLMFLLFLFITLLTSPACAASYPSNKYPSQTSSYGIWERSMVLDDHGHFLVEWTATSSDIQFRLTAKTKGYIGFGLSSQSRMHGADIVVGWVHSGKAYLQDRHGLGNLEPAVDRFQDWTIVSGYENGTHTVLHVSRPLNTCDPGNDHIISNDTTRMLWAYHPDDPVDPDSPRPRLHYHGDFRRGSKSAFLLDKDPNATGSGASYARQDSRQRSEEPPHTWTLSNPGVEIPAENRTLNWCKLFRRPLLIEKNHIVKFEPMFSAGNERRVHHMIVYECGSDDPSLMASLEQLADTSGERCDSLQMKHMMHVCSNVVVAWAVGSQGLTLPQEAGYPLSPNGPALYLMQVHYDNPDKVHYTDYSGIRMHYTHILRSYDAGVLSVGLDPIWKHLIPPKQDSVLSSGHCVAECTQEALPSTGIQVFGAAVQTHLLGREVKIRHLRNGRELDPIVQDRSYDYNYIEYRHMQTPRTVLPGDHLISECRYSSMERTAITLGGINTKDEMCLSYLYYWPRTTLSVCHSTPSLHTVLQSLGIQELSTDSDVITIKSPVELAGNTLEWRLMNYDWENQFNYFQTTTHNGTFNPVCRTRDQVLLPVSLDLEKRDYAYPNISEPWVAEDVCKRPQWPQHPKDTTPHHRRQRPHHRRQHPHLSEGLQGDAQKGRRDDPHQLSADGAQDVMFDDDMSTKPIKRIDADPVRKYLPVRDDFFDSRTRGGSSTTNYQSPGSGSSGSGVTRYGNSGRTVNTRNRTPFDELREEFDEMERELEEEVNHNRLPDSFQERTAHKNRAINNSNRVNSMSYISLSLISLCNIALISRLKKLYC